MNIQIKATNLDLTPRIKNYIQAKIGGLKKYSDQILEARVEVGLPTLHHQSGKIYRTEVNLKLPKKLLRVEKSAEHLYKSIDKARDHLEEEIRRYKGQYQAKQRRESKVRRAFKGFFHSREE